MPSEEELSDEIIKVIKEVFAPDKLIPYGLFEVLYKAKPIIEKQERERIIKKILGLGQPLGKTGSHPDDETIIFGSSVQALKGE